MTYQAKRDLFREILLDFNRKMPLFSRKKEEKEVSHLFEDSEKTAVLLESFILREKKALDLGSGNGFPGIVFSLFYPKSQFFLCERNQKKAEFLRYVKLHLKLSNVEILDQDLREVSASFALIFSKATGETEQILKLLENRLDKNGLAFLWKSDSFKLETAKESPFSLELFALYDRSWTKKKGALIKVTTRSNAKKL